MATDPQQPKDIDPQETQEWQDALESVLDTDGEQRAHFLLEDLIEQTRSMGLDLPFDLTTSYINTIPASKQPDMPGDSEMEKRIAAIIRWNAMAMVVRASRRGGELGGHIASFASAATLYDVGFNHFFKGPDHSSGADLLYIQGHSSPGIYSRAFLEGRLNEDQLDKFRQEVNGDGLSSYPHPWLMPDFWQLPTVSMGLGPIFAIYQARFLKYLHNRGMADTSERKVWCFMGDGESDEPESLGAIALAGREKLDNLIFVVNCNLQRLDGPVRGNAKIIQELEGVFRGAGWNVLKVLWGSKWDPLLERDHQGLLKDRMAEALDGDYQKYKAKDGQYVREHFFGANPELKKMVEDMSDEDIWHLNRGGHDPEKVYTAYQRATTHTGQPTVVLAKTIKGYGMGQSGEGQNISHQQKKLDDDGVRHFRDRFDVPIKDEQVSEVPYYHPGTDSDEISYMQQRRSELGGYLPQRVVKAESLPTPELSVFEPLLKGSEDREISTTMAFVRCLSLLLRDKHLKERIVPIVCDEARTFGMEGMFRQLGIYSALGQLYEPVDSDKLMFYKEQKDGQILQEGITEAGAISSWIAAATSYANNGLAMIPFYIFYSMFGFQRVGDQAWAAGDMRARGFLIGGTAGRTTLNGEGLQHEDGHSHLLAGAIPNCIAYDPAFGYEVAVIVRDGIRRMFTEQQDVFYYLTVMNENYRQPAMPEDNTEAVEDGIIRGMYLFSEGRPSELKVQLLGSGTILREAIAAADILTGLFKVSANVWSVTSFTELRRDGLDAERFNRLNVDSDPKQAHVTSSLSTHSGPIIAATDYVRAHAEQIRPYLPHNDYLVLGTDGFGRSDSRENLRQFFEVDRRHIAYAALYRLFLKGKIARSTLLDARNQLNIDPEKPNPITV